MRCSRTTTISKEIYAKRVFEMFGRHYQRKYSAVRRRDTLHSHVRCVREETGSSKIRHWVSIDLHRVNSIASHTIRTTHAITNNPNNNNPGGPTRSPATSQGFDPQLASLPRSTPARTAAPEKNSPAAPRAAAGGQARTNLAPPPFAPLAGRVRQRGFPGMEEARAAVEVGVVSILAAQLAAVRGLGFSLQQGRTSNNIAESRTTGSGI